MYKQEYLDSYNFLEKVKCENCVFYREDKCLHDVEKLSLCRFWTDKNGRRPIRAERMYYSICGGEQEGTIEVLVDTISENIMVSIESGILQQKFNEKNSSLLMRADKDLCYTKDWDKYIRGSVIPEYDTSCSKCKYHKDICVNTNKSSNFGEDCGYWVSKDNIKAPHFSSRTDDNHVIYIDTFEKKVYTVFKSGKRVGIFSMLGSGRHNLKLLDLEYEREATRDEYYDDYKLPKPKKMVVDWEEYSNASEEEIKELWNGLTDKQKVKAAFEEDLERNSRLIDKLGKVITESDLNLLIRAYNKLARKAEKEHEELYLPQILSDNNYLLQEVSDDESIVDIEKEWVSHTITYVSKFGKYYQYTYEGNYNWCCSYTMSEVKPKRSL